MITCFVQAAEGLGFAEGLINLGLEAVAECGGTYDTLMTRRSELGS